MSDAVPDPSPDSEPDSEPEIVPDINSDIGSALVPQSHDAYFKAVFSDPKRAAALLQRHLPADVSAAVDWSGLTPVPGSFTGKTLHHLHSDLLFTARSVRSGAEGCDTEGGEVLIYVLCEHQSTVDPIMPLRLLGYMTEILRMHHKHHGLPLPPVIPFVLNQGPSHWNVPTRLEDLIELPPGHAAALLPYQPKFCHEVFDLSRANPAREEPLQHQRIILHLMKLARTGQLPEFLAWLAQELSTFDPEDPVLVVSLVYAMSTDASLDEEVIARIFETNPSLRSTAMSLAERLIAKGEARGVAKGKAEGKAEGALIGRIQTLEDLSGVAVTPWEALDQLDEAALESKFRAVQQAYDKQFKRRG